MESYSGAVQLLRGLLANDQVKLVVLLIAADVLLGVFASLATKTFRLWRLADFLSSKVIPYLGGYLALRIVVSAMPEWEPIALAAWALIVAALSADVYANARLIFPVLPAPPALHKPPDETEAESIHSIPPDVSDALRDAFAEYDAAAMQGPQHGVFYGSTARGPEPTGRTTTEAPHG